jgi:hypothetical protein
MSATFEPREVEKPFCQRWLRMTLQLVVRCPARFSIAIFLLGCLDASAVRLLSGITVDRVWMVRLGMLMLPLVWVFIAAIARGADDASQTWKAFAGLAYFKVWMSALVVGIGLVALNWVIWWLMGVTASRGSAVLPGRFLESTGAQAWMVTAAAGICYFPLLVLQPALSLTEARRLSRDANDINGRRTISWLIVGMMCVLAPFSLFVPAFGMTTAAWIVFMGVLNYVAYRDIFERRSANLPKTVATASAVVAAHATE